MVKHLTSNSKPWVTLTTGSTGEYELLALILVKKPEKKPHYEVAHCNLPDHGAPC